MTGRLTVAQVAEEDAEDQSTEIPACADRTAHDTVQLS